MFSEKLPALVYNIAFLKNSDVRGRERRNIQYASSLVTLGKLAYSVETKTIESQSTDTPQTGRVCVCVIYITDSVDTGIVFTAHFSHCSPFSLLVTTKKGYKKAFVYPEKGYM